MSEFNISLCNFDDNDYELAIDEKQYSDALTILNNKADEKRTVPEKELIKSLAVVLEVKIMHGLKIQWP